MFACRKHRSHGLQKTHASRRIPRRLLRLEVLETRVLLATAEGTPLALSETLNAEGLAGSLSASIDWGDGSVTAGGVMIGGGGSLVGRVDYSLDTNNFLRLASEERHLSTSRRCGLVSLGR